MSIGLISLLMAAGAGAWIYNKFQHSSGGGANTKQSIIGATIAGAVIFLFMFLLLGSLSKN